jgi:hypothetical protein
MDHSVPIAEQISEVKSELAIRERLFPKWITIGQITRENAEKKCARMRAVLHTLVELEAIAPNSPELGQLCRTRREEGMPAR